MIAPRTFRRRPFAATAALLSTLVLAGACRSIYYGTMEAFGQHKRDLLAARVSEARDRQEEAKTQFQSALERLTELTGASDDSNLRRTYDALRAELSRSEAKASAVRAKIADIEQVADDLFEEWEDELEQFSSDDLRQASRTTMTATRQRYEQMLRAMRRPEAKMEAVLVSMRDQVLFLKHNLNAQAVASLQGTVERLELDTAELIAEMEAAIAEADAFIEGMEEQPAGG